MAAASESGIGSNTKFPRGRVLMLEHLPDIRFKQSAQGVLLIMFENGEVFFYPLNEQTKGNTPTSAKMLTTESNTGRKLRPEGSAETNRYFAYDAQLSFSPDLFKVARFQFWVENTTNTVLVPRKILLSPNKRLLLIHGCMYKDQLCLVVYQILEQSNEDSYFKLIFYDFSFVFIDACFSPNSRNIVVIPTKFPAFVLVLALPIINPKLKKTAPTTVSPDPKQKQMINFEARRAGPLGIMGPATGIFGQPLKMTHIISNVYTPSPTSELANDGYYDYVTWNDEGFGEYCLWRLTQSLQEESQNDTQQFSSQQKVIKVDWFPKLISPKFCDKAWLEEEEHPKNYILDIQFSPVGTSPKLLFVLKRENYPKKSENGIGLQMVKLGGPHLDTLSETESSSLKHLESNDVYWYLLTESNDHRDVFCVKWTTTLLLGSIPSGAAIVKGKGLFELQECRYASAFQALYDVFVNEVSNFVQIGKYHRFWVNTNGTLRVIVVTPQSPSPHPEWNELFSSRSDDLLNMRFLGRRIGYFINEIEKEMYTLDSFTRKAPKKYQDQQQIHHQQTANSSGTMDTICGLHLYRCTNCKRVLLKPLQCSRCKSVAYCSRACQRADWTQGHYRICATTTT